VSRLRIGPLDIVAAVVVLAVLFLPEREFRIESAYARVADDQRAELLNRLATAQAAVSRAPGDGVAVQAMVDLLVARGVGQHDQALRIAGEAARDEASPTRWRSLLALSWVHAERVDIPAAHEVAARALAACQASPVTCPDHERARITFYLEELAAGVQAIQRGADPRRDPLGFSTEVSKIHPTTTYRTIRGR
jgi:hypothetical protein